MIDTHAHLQDEKFNNVEKIISNAKNSNVNKIVCASSSTKTSIQAVEIASKFDNVFATVGVHPEEASEWNEQTKDTIKKLAQNKDWKTFSSLVLFFLYAIGFYVLEFKTSLLNNIIFEVLAIFVMFVLGIMACLCLIKGLKNKENLTYLPFGPALAIAGMILLVTNANLLLGLG